MKRITACAALLGLTLGGGAAFAQSLDADGDGMVSFEEMRAVYPSTTEETFESIDSDGDGMVSEAELASAEEVGLIPSEG
ncbi:EF hand [Rhodovulum sp. ES.010]|uniref:hypothetical protein n=1 Tax=Rhodovulum sp. ES.010 TaxID=1882821 RepID=UPI00092C90EB|nr:hypothetical protein [Rhodovulum sp. ES.010]SIO13098.1 EF hand [Rhodovulum sp. ES.010]